MTIIYSAENRFFSYDESEKLLTEIPCGKITKYRETIRGIQQKKEWKTGGSGEKLSGIMPMSRVLIKRLADGSEEIVQKGVLDYTLHDKDVIFSNGRHIIRISPDGTETHITKAKLAIKINEKK